MTIGIILGDFLSYYCFVPHTGQKSAFDSIAVPQAMQNIVAAGAGCATGAGAGCATGAGAGCATGAGADVY